jgi:serine/threonine protein kinase
MCERDRENPDQIEIRRLVATILERRRHDDPLFEDSYILLERLVSLASTQLPFESSKADHGLGNSLDEGRFVLAAEPGAIFLIETSRMSIGSQGSIHRVAHINEDGRAVLVVGKKSFDTSSWFLEKESEVLKALTRWVDSNGAPPRFPRFIANLKPRARSESEDRDTTWLVMERAPGENLHRWLKRNSFDNPRRIHQVLLGIALALKQIHDGGVVFGDCKSQNTIIELVDDEISSVKLIDFGSASEVDQHGYLDRMSASFISGTPACIAPERIIVPLCLRGVDLPFPLPYLGIGTRSDVYSFGCTVCDIVCSTCPAFHIIDDYRAVDRFLECLNYKEKTSSERQEIIEEHAGTMRLINDFSRSLAFAAKTTEEKQEIIESLTMEKGLAELVARCLDMDPARRPDLDDIAAVLEKRMDAGIPCRSPGEVPSPVQESGIVMD